MSVSHLDSSGLGVAKVSAVIEDLISPDSDQWNKVSGTSISLTPTPLERQPSAYIQTAWANKGHGDVSEVEVRVIRNEDSLLFRLSWQCEKPVHLINDINVYADACAVSFISLPEGSDPEDTAIAEELISTMGSSEYPVAAWYWRSGTQIPFLVRAMGLGTVERTAEHKLRGASIWSEGEWQVVLAMPFSNDKDFALLEDENRFLSFAVWTGARAERAGIKSYSPSCYQLLLNE